jgi:hypothetical protein
MRRALLLVVVLVAGSLLAAAQNSGYDVFQTGSGASVDLSSLGLGQVPLQGVAIQSSTGNADTIMYRPQAVPSGGGTIPVNLWALFMKSVNPVTFNGKSADVYVTVNATGGAISTGVLPQPDSLSASGGTITVYPNSDGSGGTFDSTITINADIIFVSAGTAVTNSANYLGHQAAPAITLSQTGSSYTTTAPSGYPLQSTSTSQNTVALQPSVANTATVAAASTTLSSGGFFPKPVHVGPHPVVPAQNTGGGCPPPTPTMTIAPGAKGSTKTAGPVQAPTGEAVRCVN